MKPLYHTRNYDYSMKCGAEKTLTSCSLGRLWTITWFINSSLKFINPTKRQARHQFIPSMVGQLKMTRTLIYWLEWWLKVNVDFGVISLATLLIMACDYYEAGISYKELQLFYEVFGRRKHSHPVVKGRLWTSTWFIRVSQSSSIRQRASTAFDSAFNWLEWWLKVNADFGVTSLATG